MRASPFISTFAPGGGAQRALPRLQVQCHLRIGSPDRCAASPPGNSATLRSVPGGGAQRALPGLQVQCRLRAGRLDRCAASPPGNDATLRAAPGGCAQRALPGLQILRLPGLPVYRFSAVCGPVARTDAQHRLRDRSLTPTVSPPAPSTAPRRAGSAHR